MHEQYDLLDMFGPDIPSVPPESALKQVTAVFLGFAAFGWIVYKFAPESPAVPRGYPFSGLVKELGGMEENKAREEIIEDNE